MRTAILFCAKLDLYEILQLLAFLLRFDNYVLFVIIHFHCIHVTVIFFSLSYNCSILFHCLTCIGSLYLILPACKWLAPFAADA